jgi:hypothetical protein
MQLFYAALCWRAVAGLTYRSEPLAVETEPFCSEYIGRSNPLCLSYKAICKYNLIRGCVSR